MSSQTQRRGSWLPCKFVLGTVTSLKKKNTTLCIPKAVYMLCLAVKVRNAAERGGMQITADKHGIVLVEKMSNSRRESRTSSSLILVSPSKTELNWQKSVSLDKFPPCLLEERMFLLCLLWRKPVVVIACVIPLHVVPKFGWITTCVWCPCLG